MALVLKDRVKQYTSTVGTSSFVLSSTPPEFQAFSAIGDGNTTYYTAKKDSDWEVGIGTYTLSTTTLTRDTILASSNSGAIVSFGSGLKEVICCYPAEKAVTTDQTLGVSSGGTGTNTTFTQGSVIFAGASGTYSQDNSNLFWDDTNNRLGVHTTTPASTLEVRHNDTATNAIDFLTDTGNGGGYKSRFRIENNASQAAVDMNLYGVEVNVGSYDPDSSASADMRFLQPSGGTSNLIQIFPPGRNPAVNGNPAAYFGPNGNLVLQVGGLASTALSVKTGGDAQNKFTISETGVISIGPGGSTAPDTNLYRNAANELKTDDALVVAGNLTCSSSVLSPTLVTPALGTPTSGNLTNCTGVSFVSGIVGLSKGTSFPVSPSSGDLFWRTDRAIQYYYDGTRWLSVDSISLSFGTVSAISTNVAAFAPLPYLGTYSLWMTNWTSSMYRAGAGEWDWELYWADSANVSTLIDTQDGSADSNATWYNRTRSLGSVVNANAKVFVLQYAEKSGTTNVSGSAEMECKLVG